MNKSIIGLAFLPVIAIILIISTGQNPEEPIPVATMEESALSLEDELEQKALDFVNNYRGQDGLGKTLDEIITTEVTITYPDENIISNLSKLGGSFAVKDFTEEGNFYEVHLFFETDREIIDYAFYTDLDTGKIVSGNERAKNLLYVLDTFD